MPKTLEFDQAVSDQIVALREDGSKWDEISEAMEMPAGKCMLIWNHATVAKKDRIKDATGEDIVNLRDGENLSWGVISARTGYPESSCRGMYEIETKTSTKGNRIGKGGRHPESEGTPRQPRAKKAEGSTKKTAAKATGKAAESKLEGMTNEEVKEAIELRAIKVLNGDTEETIKVKSVKRVSKATVAVVNEEGKARTVKRAAVVGISRGKAFKS